MSLLHDLIAAGKKQEMLEILRSSPEETLKQIINDVDLGTQAQETPLHRAVLAGWADAIPALVRAGADTTIKNFFEEDALFVAVSKGKLDVAAALLKSGASAKSRKFDDQLTALQFAIKEKNLPMVELLLQYSADMAAKTPPVEKGMNAFHYAANSTPEIMDLLLRQPDASAVHEIAYVERRNTSALRIALENGDRVLTEKLLAYGVNVNEVDDNGETPLFHLLAHRSSRETAMPLVRLLLRHGADVEKARNFWDETLLYPAVRESFTEAVGFLLDLGIEAKHQNHMQETPLHLAAEKWDAKIVRELISHGAEVDALNRLKRTALHIAAKSNRPAVVEALLDAGADPFLKDKDGKTPRDLAPAAFQQNVNRLLSQKERELEIQKYGYALYSQRKAAEARQTALQPPGHKKVRHFRPHRQNNGWNRGR